jgi:hypothetical protein
MHARIGVLRALNRHVERVFNQRPQGPELGSAKTEAGSLTSVTIVSARSQIFCSANGTALLTHGARRFCCTFLNTGAGYI